MIKLEHVTKKYKTKIVLDNFSLSVEAGEMIAITGPSGSGKSTILNILGLIESFDSGTYKLFDQSNIKPNSKTAMSIIREDISYLFQNFALIEDETVEYNLMLGIKYLHATKADKVAIINDALQKVGLQGYGKSPIFELSGGQQQRIAVARALIKPSKLILADEPTGSLDQKNRDEIMQLLKSMNKQGKTVIVVTHDDEVANQCQRIVHLSSVSD